MNRRDFLKSGCAVLAAAGVPAYAAQLADARKRVGLIGTGWYGKVDLLRMIQVAPIEVVSLCDVDRRMLADAADLVAARQTSKKKPRTYADYRDLLNARDLDIVLIDTPDHWHALPMIEAVQAGLDVWVQKPISVDIVEGQAMLAAARKYKRVVQVGMQRRSTPHLVRARDRVIRAGLLGTVGLVEIYCYYHMRARDNPPDSQPPEYLDYAQWTGPAPMRPYNALVHPRSWRAFMEYGNGIVGDMCAMDAGSGHADPRQFVRRHPGGQTEQGQHHRLADRHVRLRHSAGRLGPSHLRRVGRSEIPVGRDVLRRQGDAEGERDGLWLRARG
jgi:Oxidoreductase family, NAD-binding Rossmann fold/Oxidoreductase family, C-terminal alpha/beta domain